MTYVYTDIGRDFFEDAIVDPNYSETIDTISVGDGDNSPSTSDTELDNLLYRASSSSGNVTIERGSGVGEIRLVIEVTGGTEVPADSEIRELGIGSSDSILIYRERRSSAISVASGETKIIEIRIFADDVIDSSSQVLTNVGLDEIADISIGNSTEKLKTIAIGEGTNDVDSTDTTMQDEIYRDDRSANNIIVETTSNIGEIRAEATLSAGSDADDEVAADSAISEFGLFSNGTLVLHETRPAVTLELNDSKTFKIPFTITQ